MPDELARLAGRKKLRVAGLMSGTSADGVDVAIVDIAGRKVEVVAFDTQLYPADLRRRIFDLFDPRSSRVDDICHMNFILGEVFAQALLTTARRKRVPLGSIDLIGSHGQTIYHIPKGRRSGKHLVRSTLQIGEPSVIAEQTGITTVADFRPRDIAAGGQGAPLVPYADWLLFTDKRKTRAIQNIGGIANVTYLPAGGGIEDVLAFDTGPGNMVIDRVVQLMTRGRLAYDAGGRLAARGTIREDMLAGLMRHRYLRRNPPKTTGREEFGTPYADTLYDRGVKRHVAPLDILTTVTAFTARSIADAYRRFLPRPVDEVILCGGGAWNRTLVEMLRKQLPSAKVAVMDEYGISVDAKEAVSFAILAYETAHGRCNNVPSATGARHPVVLGKIVPGRTISSEWRAMSNKSAVVGFKGGADA
jgi:anhydro-N-acetylmuramic acid kinase